MLSQNQADSLAKAMGYDNFQTIQTKVSDSNFNGSVANEIATNLQNVLYRQVIVDSFKFRSAIVDMFMVSGLAVSEGEQVIENKLINASLYSPDEFIPTKNSGGEQLQMFIKTKDKVKFERFWTKEVISRAFTNIPAFDSFYSNYMKQLTDSIYLYLYNAIIKDIVPNVKVSLEPSGIEDAKTEENGYTALQQSIIQFFQLKENMTDVPTNAYNLDGRLRKMQFIDANELVVLVNPTTLNEVVRKALPKLFHDRTINVKSLEVLKLKGLNDYEMIIMHKRAYRIFKRIDEAATQYFADNMTIYHVVHMWLTRGVVNWFPAVKYVLNTKKNTYAVMNIGGTAAISSGALTGMTVGVGLQNGVKDYNFGLGTNDWLMVRILGVDGTIYGDMLYNNNPTSVIPIGPDDYSPRPGTVAKLPALLNASGNSVIPVVLATFPLGANIVAGKQYLIQVFSYFEGTASTSNAKLLTL